MFEDITMTHLLYSLPIFIVAVLLSFIVIPRVKAEYGLVILVAGSLIVWAAGLVVLTDG